jgi:hypothetical protein
MNFEDLFENAKNFINEEYNFIMNEISNFDNTSDNIGSELCYNLVVFDYMQTILKNCVINYKHMVVKKNEILSIFTSNKSLAKKYKNRFMEDIEVPTSTISIFIDVIWKKYDGYVKDYTENCIKFDIDIEEKNIIRTNDNIEGRYLQHLREDIGDIIDDCIELAENLTEKLIYDTTYKTTIKFLGRILNKYKNKCYFTSKINTRDNFAGVALLNKDASIYTFYTDEQIEDLVEEISNQLNGCIGNKIEVIAIPIIIPGHANALIYKINTNTFEYFEPHGIHSSILVQTKIDDFINYLMNTLVDNKIIPKNPIYKSSEKTCPLINNKASGLQRFETRENIKIIANEFFPKDPGFCQMWSIFYLELSLRHPTVNTESLVQIAFDYIKSKYGDLGFTLFIVGYIKYLYNNSRNTLCFNMENEKYDDVLRFLDENNDNVIYSKNDDIMCYKREKLSKIFIGVEKSMIDNPKYRFFKYEASTGLSAYTLEDYKSL